MPAKKAAKKQAKRKSEQPEGDDKFIDFHMPEDIEKMLQETKGKVGRPLDDNVKKLVANFADLWDSTYGRGGAAEAQRRWGISPGAVSAFRKAFGKDTSPKTPRKRAGLYGDLQHAADMTKVIDELEVKLADLKKRRARILIRIAQS